jgi:hypothetical protein
MSPSRIISFWGSENLKRWSASCIRDVVMPRSSREFLTDVGLPDKEEWTLRFDEEADQLPRLRGKTSYRRLGFDGSIPICIDENRGGCIVVLESEMGGPERYVNSNVESFAAFLTLYGQYRRTPQSVTEKDLIENVIPRIEGEMREIDPIAFSYVENYWPVIVEQMKDGLL